MRSKLALLALSASLVAATVAFAPQAAAAPPTAAAQGVPGCGDDDYICGYFHGFLDGRTAKEWGLCDSKKKYFFFELTRSEQGWKDGFEHYCPA